MTIGERHMKRVTIFGSACCIGWCFLYDADDAVQAMIAKHAEEYNSVEKWQARHSDGSVKIFDCPAAAIAYHNEGCDEDEDKVSTIDDLLAVYTKDGDGRSVDAAWIVHILLSDATSSEWLPK